ncbi:hypothetical protein UFOVP325_67 [uncultured Caudovirales phage]|jgi:hypothetical protein|uniref:Uncharacterized protein n=1 Tax=uncultured Caudovirales phage TaxID=2100421 RepID=A0A6J5MQH4_9CAUD|nr:hypothetical protein UFOVP325_67 [uncultured Caudovirales phage]CAB4147977.1 hypothetical protein UFOVP430_62 [uncultured Caudovirales phage]
MTISGAGNPTSYFSTPSTELDPQLFQGRQLRDWVRTGIVSMLQDYLHQKFRHSELWAHPWLAGSGVSYQWSAARQPGDLDCLVGVNFTQFRQANPEYRGLTDKQVSAEINEGFRADLQPQTENWNGYELTFYVNPTGTDIRNIKPYAAYDLKYNEWTVTPDPTQTPPVKPEWDAVVDNDYDLSSKVHVRFTAALSDLQDTRNGASQRNAEARLTAAAQQGNALYEEIHGNRALAFSSTGEGYNDFNNYRWQAGKRTGAVDTLRAIRKYSDDMTKTRQAATYGVELPDTDTLIRRAALYRAK